MKRSVMWVVYEVLEIYLENEKRVVLFRIWCLVKKISYFIIILMLMKVIFLYVEFNFLYVEFKIIGS